MDKLMGVSNKSSSSSSSFIQTKNLYSKKLSEASCRRAEIEGFYQHEYISELDFHHMANHNSFRTWYKNEKSEIFKTKFVTEKDGWKWSWRVGKCKRIKPEKKFGKKRKRFISWYLY